MNSKAIGSFTEAWQVVTVARTVFGVLLVAAMLIHLGLFLWSFWGTPIDPVLQTRMTPPICSLKGPCGPMMPCGPMGPGAPCLPGAAPVATADTPATILPGAAATTAPASQPATASMPTCGPMSCKPIAPTVDSETMAEAQRYQQVFAHVMKFSGMLSILGVTFMVLAGLMGVMVLVAGQQPGAGSATSAFFYAVFAGLLLLVDWSRMLGDIPVFPNGLADANAMMDALRLVKIDAETTPRCLKLGAWLQQCAYPAIVLLAALMYLGKSAKANSQVNAGMAAGPL
jgi:hypothetical protein